jgi:lipopolysaccharide export system protein LptC
MPRLPLLILLLIVSAAIALWESPPAILKKAKAPGEVKTFPVAYMESANSKKFGPTGHLKYTFAADRVNYFEFKQEHKNYAQATQPVITLYSEDGLPWHIKAEHGHSDSKGSTITFTGNVVVWQVDANQARTELQTEKLVVMPEREFAETDRAVKLIAPSGVTTAVGMEAIFKQDRLLLLSQVESTIRSNYEKAQ